MISTIRKAPKLVRNFIPFNSFVGLNGIYIYTHLYEYVYDSLAPPHPSATIVSTPVPLAAAPVQTKGKVLNGEHQKTVIL